VIKEDILQGKKNLYKYIMGKKRGVFCGWKKKK